VKLIDSCYKETSEKDRYLRIHSMIVMAKHGQTGIVN